MSLETLWVLQTWRKTHRLHFIRAFDAMFHRARGTKAAHVETRPESARHTRCPAHGRQRRTRGQASLAQPLRDEPDARAPAGDDGRSAARQGWTRPRSFAARTRAARPRRSARTGRERRVVPQRGDRSRSTRSNVHAANERGVRGDVRLRHPRPRRRRGAARAAALHAEATQGQRSASRRQRRPGDGRGRQDDRAGGAYAGAVSGSLGRRGASRTCSE